MNLSDKIIIVTGGLGLLGKEFVSDIKKRGGIPINLDINNKNDLPNGVLHLDINDDNSINDAINSVMKKFGRIDGVVNNAFYNPRTNIEQSAMKFEDYSLDLWNDVVSVNLTGVFLCSQIFGKIMAKQNHFSLTHSHPKFLYE